MENPHASGARAARRALRRRDRAAQTSYDVLPYLDEVVSQYVALEHTFNVY